MIETKLLGTWVRRFLLDYLVNERNLALNTRRSFACGQTDAQAVK
ncbi:MAG: integrase/recombinase XerD [Granulosicoccus sp.]|jgi:integrase/recombinase XerD